MGNGWNMRKALAGLAILALLAGACSGDDSEASTESTDAPVATDAPTDEPDEGGGDEAPEPEDPATTDAPAELTASFRGVTETAIKVGVAVPDFDALQDAGIGNYQGDADIAFQAFIDVINAEGGVFGRQIEPVYVTYDFLDPATQDLACAELVNDHEVFIVLYGLLTTSNLCLTELNDTMVMTRSFQTSALRESSGDTLWLQLNASDDERTRILARTVAETGRLEGKTIGILASQAQGDGLEGEVLEETLQDLGYDSTLLIGTADQGDALARESELSVFAQRFSSEGVDLVFDLTGGGNATGTMADAGFSPEIIFKALGPAVDGAADRTLLDGAIGVGEKSETAIFEDPDFQATCMDVVREANPDLADEISYAPTGDEQAAGIPSWINPIMIACDHTMLLDLVGETVGADLTNDTFRAALDELGPVQLNGYGLATYGSEAKWDGLDEFYVLEYSAESDSIEIVGDPIVVDR